MTIHDEIPMPPSHGWIVVQTPRAPRRILWPIPSSIRKRGMPSRINMTAKGIKNAPRKREKIKYFNTRGLHMIIIILACTLARLKAFRLRQFALESKRNFIKKINCKLHLYVTNLKYFKLILTLLITVIRVIPQHDFISLENFSRDGTFLLTLIYILVNWVRELLEENFEWICLNVRHGMSLKIDINECNDCACTWKWIWLF